MMTEKSEKSKPRNVYAKNFLDKVIVRLDFASALVGINESVPSKVAKYITSSFPIKAPGQKVYSGQFKIEKDGKADAQSQLVGRAWEYHGEKRDKTVSIASQWAWIQYRAYQSVDVLRKDFLCLVGVLFEEYGDQMAVNRFGMRYIDKIDVGDEDPTDWKKYIKPKLLSSIGIVTDKNTISRAFNMLGFNYDDMHMTFQFGIFNPDYPAPVRRREFTLDFDAYCQGCIEQANIETYFDRFHDKIKESFEECITEELRDVMRDEGR